VTPKFRTHKGVISPARFGPEQIQIQLVPRRQTETKPGNATKTASVWVVPTVGFLLGAPAPFSLAAIGIIVRNGYAETTPSPEKPTRQPLWKHPSG